MAKKSGVKIPAIAVIRLIVFLFIGFVLFQIYSRSTDFLGSCELFAVREVVLDPSLQFVDDSDLQRLKGRNIFNVDLKRLQKRIQAQYPHISQLRVTRELPDRIRISAKKRQPLFQIMVKGKALLVDADTTAMYYVSTPADLPTVQGALSSSARVTLGAPLPQLTVSLAARIIQALKSKPHISRLKIANIDLTNLSKIDVALGALHVILDQGSYASKLDILEMLLVQKKIDFAQVKYVDLRFNEPVLGENTNEPKTGK